MFQIHSFRVASLAAIGVLLILWGTARAGQELQADAAAALEVRVLGVDVPAGQGEGEGFEVIYQMEVISVLRASSRVKPGETILVRAHASRPTPQNGGSAGPGAPALLSPGWMGIAYLNPDPKASGPEARLQFTTAANGDSFAEIPRGPPSLRWTE